MLSRRQGYTLLELSIVIVIIGLISGVIMAGKEFTRRHELRRMLVDTETYVIAIQQFKQKYSAMPGDMPNATSYWGRVFTGTPPDTTPNAQCADPLLDVSTGKETCNGDGDGKITSNNCEHYRVWQQLVAADFLNAKFSGVSGTANCSKNSVPNVNVPAGPGEDTAFSISSFGVVDTASPMFSVLYPGNYDNILVFGGVLANDYSVGPALKPEAALEVDSKMDDGSGATGTVRSARPSSASTPNCVNANGEYSVGITQISCAMIFMNTYMNRNNR